MEAEVHGASHNSLPRTQPGELGTGVSSQEGFLKKAVGPGSAGKEALTGNGSVSRAGHGSSSGLGTARGLAWIGD